MLPARLFACLLLLAPLGGCRAKVETTAPLFQRTISTADAPAETLSMSVHYSFAADGTYTRVARHRYRLLTDAGVKSWGTISETWEPWFQDRPELTATVTTPDGGKVTLDPSTISAGPAQTYSEQVFSDAQVVRAPLPALSVGAEVEEVVTVRSTKPLPWAQVHMEGLQGPIKRGAQEVVIEAPEKMAIHYLVDGTGVAASEQVVGGRRKVRWAADSLPALDFPESGLPSDVHYWPRLVFRVHDQSWRDVARGYADFVDEALAGFKPPAPAQAIIDAKAERAQKIDALLEWVHDRVRYSGLELGTGTVIPTAPATVLARGYGDCKDKATMLVGLLRAAGIEAHVALLRAGRGADITTAFPGISEFNHAIVYLPGREPQWIDPTSEFSRADQLPGSDRGRMALVAARDSQAPVLTPRARADENTYTETRTVTLAEFGKASVREEITATGELELGLRDGMDGSRKSQEDALKTYAGSEYDGGKLRTFEITPSGAVATPYRFVLDIDKAGVGETTLATATVTIGWGSLWKTLPGGILADSDEDDEDEKDKDPDKHLRKSPLAVPTPFDSRLVYRIKLPAGFEPTLPTLTPVDLGPVLLERKVSRDREDVVVELRVRLDGPQLTPEQVNQFRKAVKLLDKQETMRVVAVHRASLAYDKKDLVGALAIVAKEAKAGSTMGRMRHADVLGSVHLNAEALAELRGVIAGDPANAYAYALMGDIHRRNRFGQQHGAGWQRNEAIAATLKSAELDDLYKRNRIHAANDAETGDEGVRLGDGADLVRAAEIWAMIEPETITEFGDANLPNNPLLVLWYLERYDALAAAVAKQRADAPRLGKLLMAWRRGSITGVLEELRSNASAPSADRAQDLKAIFAALVGRESYPNLVTLAEAAGSLGVADDPNVKVLGTTVRTAAKAAGVVTAATGVKHIYIDLLDAAILPSREAADRATEALLSTRITDRERVLKAMPWRDDLRSGGTPIVRRFTRDMLVGGTVLTTEGSDATGYRLTATLSMGEMTDRPFHLFVVREGKQYRVRATAGSRAEIGREALARAVAGDLEAARQWLRWSFENQHKTDDHPLAQSPDLLLWTDPKADPALVARVSLTLFGDREAFKAIVAARAKVKDDDPLAPILDHAIVIGGEKGDAAHTERAMTALRAKYPDAEALASLEIFLATDMKDWKTLDRLIPAYLTRFPNAHGMKRRHARSYVSRGDFTRAIDILSGLQALGVAQEDDFNNLAWWSLFVGDGVPSERALEWATRAAASNVPGRVHTLGCVYAAMGRTLQALETFNRLVADGNKPDLSDEYLLAEVHRQLGFTAQAREVYTRVAKEDPDDPDSTGALARRRLARAAKP
jgi:tetratricopeptide (TPR) repeat protein